MFKRNKKVYILILVVCISMFFSNLTILANEKAEFTLKFGGSDPVGGLEDQSNKLFIKLVEEKSNGRIKIDYFPQDQLGKEDEQVEGMQMGTQDFFSDPMGLYSNSVNDFRVLSYGYVFNDVEHLDKFLMSPLFEDLVQQLIDSIGVRILAAGHRTPRVLFTVKPVLGLEDIQGMKMRCPPIESYVKLWTSLGTKPTQVDWPETYLALRQGVAEGIEASIAVCYHMRHHEVCPYLALTNHMMDQQHIAISELAYQKLPEDLQAVLVEAAQESMDFYSKEADKSEEEYIEKIIEEGGTVIRFNLDPWKERARATFQEIEESGYWRKGLAAAIDALD